MGPKKGKDITEDENYWRLCIEEAILNEESWSVKVIMIEAAGSDQDRIYLNKFETYAAQERRFVIKNICKTETIFMINQLGGEKKVKDDNLRVFEEGQAYLKDKKDVPPEILALVIKYLILKMKEEYLFIKRQRLEVGEGMKRESITMISKADIKGTVHVKTVDKDAEESTIKGKVTAIPNDSNAVELDENKKYGTLLRVRGEEWRDKVYIDDFPIDGPNLYIAVTGFLESRLAECLIKIGIPLTAVVQIRIDPSKSEIPSTLFRQTKRGHSQTEILADLSFRYWNELQELRINKHTADHFKNTAFIVFSPPYWSKDKLSGCDDKIYDEVCYLLYDVHDLSRQHNHYLNNMDIISVPDAIRADEYQHKYISKVDNVPLESVTVYLVLNAVLDTVCECINFDENNGTLSTFSINSLKLAEHNKEDKVNKSEELVECYLNNLNNIDASKKRYRVTSGKIFEKLKNPIVINHGNFLKYGTYHLNYENYDNIVSAMLSGMPVYKIWHDKNKPVEEIDSKLSFHTNVLLSCFDRKDIEKTELYRLLNILAFRKVYNNRSSLKKEHLLLATQGDFKKKFLKRSVVVEPLRKLCKYSNSKPSSLCSVTAEMGGSYESFSYDSSYSTSDAKDETSRLNTLFSCPDISELASVAEITHQTPIDHIIDNYEYFEDFTDVSALQVLHAAFNKFNCVDYKYCEVTDCFILMFFNNHDNNRIACEEWRSHLPTHLCLQDFFDFVLEEHYDWIKNEQKIYDENMKLESQLDCKDTNNAEIEKSCIESFDVDQDLLIEGSLKYEELKELEETTPETSDSTKSNMKSNVDLAPKIEKKKPKSLPIESQKIESEELTEIIKKPFSAYDLGDRRVEFFGKNSTFFSEDGTLVSSLYSLLIPMNLEYLTLNINPGGSHTEFWMHKALGEFVNPNVVDTCESFRIKTKDQLIIYLRKQLFGTNVRSGSFDNNTDNVPPDLNNKKSELYVPKSFYSLLLTWPSGLITESVYESNSSTISHIKQYYLSNVLNINEDMRCLSLNGEVIVFNSNGGIKVLKPDGTYFSITKYAKKLINEDVSEDVSSTAGSNKSKKFKGKDKAQKSKNFVPKKLSQSGNIELENLVGTKTNEYELQIEEFEVIENSLREIWQNNKQVNIEQILTKTATDYCLGEIFSRRMDGTSILLNKDGLLVVTFPDDTKITTSYVIEDQDILPEWTEEEIEYLSTFEVENERAKVKPKCSESQQNLSSQSKQSSGKLETNNLSTPTLMENQINDGYVSIKLIYVIEHPNFSSVTINKCNNTISIDSPNNTSVTVDSNNNYEFILDEATSATFNGQFLNTKHVPCIHCESINSCEIKICSEDIISDENQEYLWLKMRDAFGKYVTVDEEGNLGVETLSSDTSHNSAPKNSQNSISNSIMNENLLNTSAHTRFHMQYKEMLLANSLQFFVLRRDLTCSELVHRLHLEKYIESCQRSPWGSISEFDTFGDYRRLWSILTPVYFSESEKWLMESKLRTKPTNMTFKDLKVDTGKGFYHWMRPYKRFKPKPITPDPVIPERPPRAFILRICEQQWPENVKQQLKGAKELVVAILRYRHLIEAELETLTDIPIRDFRTEDEKKTYEVVQAVAHRVYEDVKKRLINDARGKAKQTITTEPNICSEDNLLKELEEYEELESDIKEVEATQEMSPELKRYWRRRTEEYKEEQFYKYLLRQDDVPPYFRNVLGGGIWRMVHDAVDGAATCVRPTPEACECID